jgi:hypothetical protein
MMLERFRLAVITTVFRPNSHSDVIVSRWLNPLDTDREVGWPLLGHEKPRTAIASLYIQQFPENDTGREAAERYVIPLYSTVRDALTLGGNTLAVDGVLLIAEHGNFPHNQFFQKMYPRWELFDEVVAVFRECGRSVPVFTDKHLSYDTDSALHMVGASRELNFPLMAGSSIPLGRYAEDIGLSVGSDLTEGLGIFGCDVESYGYHSLEFLQSLVARRAGGESGIESVTSYSGDGYWEAQEAGIWSSDLLEAALETTTNCVPGAYRDNLRRTSLEGGLPHHPAALCFQHCDGLRTSHLFMEGHVSDFTVAVRQGNGAIRSCCNHYCTGADLFFRHFATLNAHIEEFMLTGKSPYPLEHYLLCTMALNAGVRALAAPGQRIETPELNVPYRLEDNVFS